MTKSSNKNKSVERKIYFYKIVCKISGKEVKSNDIFDEYIKLLDSDYSDLQNRNLAIPYYEKYHFLEITNSSADTDTYFGKFYSLRSTDFPYLFNIKNGNRKEISYNDQDTLMEQTHFYCFTNQRLIVSEFNFYGARIEKLAEYLSDIMLGLHPSRRYSISILPIVIPNYYEQIINCTSISKIQFKVAHPGLKILTDEGIIGISDIVRSNLDENSDFYIDIELSGGGKGRKIPIKDSKSFLNKIISAIKKGSNKCDEESVFRKAKIKAYNPKELKTIPYDLLDEKLVHTCRVEKISSKSKYVNSDKMFSEIISAYNEQKDDALRYIGEI